jgi:hypothetical protein
MKDRLGRRARQSRNALADKVLHPLRDMRLFEERPAIGFSGDQFVQLLDLVAELDGQRVGLDLAGVADGFHQ